jgi:uncharacterized repeat protein (TIGR03803 family)
LYGTTAVGGSNDAGTIFKLDRSGTDYQVLYSFAGTNGDGRAPRAKLLEGSDGLLYGTTEYGGLTNSSYFGSGTIFRINKTGGGYLVLHQFTGADDGGNPYGGLVEGVEGYLFGTTFYGGTNDGGTVFKMDKQGADFTVLHNLSGLQGDGRNSYATLLKGTDGVFYGTTRNGGDTNRGTIFRLFSANPTPFFSDIAVNQTGARLVMQGAAAGETYRLEFKTNLKSNAIWESAATNVVTVDGSVQFLDATATNSSARFYRAARK